MRNNEVPTVLRKDGYRFFFIIQSIFSRIVQIENTKYLNNLKSIVKISQ